MRVLFITLFSQIGGTSRVYVYQFLPYLEKAGIHSVVKTIYSDRFFRLEMGLVRMGAVARMLNLFFYHVLALWKRMRCILVARNYDVIYIQKDTFPKFFYWALRKINPRIIYGFEDAIYEPNPFWERSIVNRILFRYRRRLFRNMVKNALRVMTENEYLAREARKYNPNVFVITFSVDEELYAPSSRIPNNKDLVTIGWIGSPSTTYLLEEIKPVFREICARYPNVDIKIVGADQGFSMPDARLIHKEWSLETELADLQSFDIGLMPLNDSPFNRGRLGGKMVLYMSVGIPIVASNIGLNRSVIQDGVNGFLVMSIEEWVERLSLLIEDEELRHRLGRNGRRIAEKVFSTRNQAKILIEALLKTAGSSLDEST